MKIGVIGTGYVGLTLAILADYGNEILFVGRSPKKIEDLKKCKLPIYEPGLDEVVIRNIKSNRLDATTDYSRLENTEIIFICVGTPSLPDWSIDTSQIKAATESLGLLLKEVDDYKVIVVKSTVVPGTTQNIVVPVLEKNSGKNVGEEFGVCMNPEFLKEGTSVDDFVNPDKVVIGGYDEKSRQVIAKLYSFYDSKVPIILTNLNTAEMIKYAQNAALASRISFINEIANICEKFKVDVTEVSNAIGLDSRIGPKFLNAGAGFGGSCFPKDVKALVAAAKSAGIKPILLNAILEVNKTQPYRMLELAKQTLGNLKGKTIGILGLAFKADTDDMREASSIPIIKALVKKGSKVKVYDPQAMENAKQIFTNSVEYCNSKYDCIKDVDLCMVLTEWDEFKKIDLTKVKCPIVDGRRIFNPTALKQYGLAYKGIGWRDN